MKLFKKKGNKEHGGVMEAVNLYKMGVPTKEIYRLTHVQLATMYDKLKEEGVELRAKKQVREDLPEPSAERENEHVAQQRSFRATEEDKKQLVDLYKAGVPKRQIEKITGRSDAILYNALKEHNVPLRCPGLAGEKNPAVQRAREKKAEQNEDNTQHSPLSLYTLEELMLEIFARLMDKS